MLYSLVGGQRRQRGLVGGQKGFVGGQRGLVGRQRGVLRIVKLVFTSLSDSQLTSSSIIFPS